MRRHHDMGGLKAGPIDRTEHDDVPWEKQVNVILRLLASREPPVMTVDELRRGIEDLGPGEYDALSYYERWIRSIANILIEKGVLSVDALGGKMAEVEARWREDAQR